MPGQTSLGQMASVKNGPRNLALKFGQNQVSNLLYGQILPGQMLSGQMSF